MSAELMSLAQAQEWVARAVATQPAGFVYNWEEGGGCYYLPQSDLPDTDPRSRTGCLIGTAMVLAGRTVLDRHEMNSPVDQQEDWHLSPDAAAYLCQVQERQDTGYAWQDAAEYGLAQYLRTRVDSGLARE